MRRAIVVVIDSMGIGAMPDCAEYNDVSECNTLVNVAKANNGLNLPTMQTMGLGNLSDICGQCYRYGADNNKSWLSSDGFFSVLFVLCAVGSVMGKTGECFPAAAAGELFGSDAAIGGKQ